MTPPALRQATALHAPVLAAIHAEAFDDAWSAVDLAVLLKDAGAAALLAVDDAGEPLGFVLCRRVLDEAEVLTIATRPAARRQGVAAALLEAVIALLAEAGAKTLFLEVAEDNTAARALYDARGFAPVGRRKGYYARRRGPAVDALVLARDIS